MTQKRFKKLLMAQGVSAHTARGLVEYMKAVRYCIEKRRRGSQTCRC